MSLRTQLGRVTAKLAGLVVWLTGGRLIKSPAPTVTSSSHQSRGSTTPWWLKGNSYLAWEEHGFAESGSPYTHTTPYRSSELSPEERMRWAQGLQEKYGISNAMTQEKTDE